MLRKSLLVTRSSWRGGPSGSTISSIVHAEMFVRLDVSELINQMNKLKAIPTVHLYCQDRAECANEQNLCERTGKLAVVFFLWMIFDTKFSFHHYPCPGMHEGSCIAMHIGMYSSCSYNCRYRFLSQRDMSLTPFGQECVNSNSTR